MRNAVSTFIERISKAFSYQQNTHTQTHTLSSIWSVFLKYISSWCSIKFSRKRALVGFGSKNKLILEKLLKCDHQVNKFNKKKKHKINEEVLVNNNNSKIKSTTNKVNKKRNILWINIKSKKRKRMENRANSVSPVQTK